MKIHIDNHHSLDIADARKSFKEASAAHDIERRVLELETRVAELERTARK